MNGTQNGVGAAVAAREDETQGEDKDFKPVYLKGLFRWVASRRASSHAREL